MSSDSLAVHVHGLSKVYNIYSKPVDRLKQSIVPRLLRLAGRPPRAYHHEFWALRDVSLEVHKGETVGIIGRNGSGKSTLLQMICGTLTPTTGEIKTHGRIAALLELGSGFNPEFTGRENVFLNGAILGLSQDEISQRFAAIASFADIGEFIEQPVKFYSSGMMVRLAFAVQAMVDPDILIVDEALAVGDERFQRKCFSRLEELKKSGTSILFVSHSGQQIIELCDRALLLEGGRRIFMGQPLSVARGYQRLIYASPEVQSDILAELTQRDLAGVSDKDAEVLIDPQQKEAPLLVPSHFDTSETLPDSVENDFYEGSLIPQSTEFMPEMGARIENVQIFNLHGQQVNNLLMGREYLIKVQGIFLKNSFNVYFGYHIRSRAGVTVAGTRYPGAVGFVHEVSEGQRYRITFPVKMHLLPDVYFINSGVWSSQEPVRLHQVLDFAMFRVLPQKDNPNFGYLNISVRAPEFKIGNNFEE